MTEIKELTAPTHITCYMLIKLNNEGNFSELKPTYNTHKVLGGYWASKEEVQHIQMLEALKDQHYRVFEINWEI